MIGADGEFTTITISLKDIFTSIVRTVYIVDISKCGLFISHIHCSVRRD